MEIPIIDLSNGNPSLEETTSIGKACLEFGFFYVVNHGIASELQANVLEKLWTFFNLPAEKKEEIHRRHGFRGYFSQEEERSIEYGCTEWKEGIYYFRDFTNVPEGGKEAVFCGLNPWPNDKYVPEFRAVMLEYFTKTQQLASKLLGCIALSLGIFRYIYIYSPLFTFTQKRTSCTRHPRGGGNGGRGHIRPWEGRYFPFICQLN